jgi:large subunit ribosomal protein L21
VPEQASPPVAIQSADVGIAAGPHITEREFSVSAIVRCGGRQEKASVDDVITVDRLTGEVGSTLTLPAVLVVDGDNVVTDADELGGYQVAAEIVGDVSGPKINMIRYKNKTGYRRRLGHRQRYTQVKITGITKGGERPAGTSAGSAKAAPAGPGKATSGSTRTKSAAGKGAPTGPGKATPTGPGKTGSAGSGKAASGSARTRSAASKAPASAAGQEESAEES